MHGSWRHRCHVSQWHAWVLHSTGVASTPAGAQPNSCRSAPHSHGSAMSARCSHVKRCPASLFDSGGVICAGRQQLPHNVAMPEVGGDVQRRPPRIRHCCHICLRFQQHLNLHMTPADPFCKTFNRDPVSTLCMLAARRMMRFIGMVLPIRGNVPQ